MKKWLIAAMLLVTTSTVIVSCRDTEKADDTADITEEIEDAMDDAEDAVEDVVDDNE